MGLCYSKAGWLATSTDTYTDCSELSTSNCKYLMYESPRWSADTGDKGKLGTLFYKRRRRRCQHPDLFSARLEGLLGGIHHTFQMKQYSPGDNNITFASSVGTPFVRNLEMQGMDSLARSYAISAAKASARNTFLLLQERDKSETVEVLSPMIKIQMPDRSSDDEFANEITIVEQDDGDDDGPEYDEVLELENNIQGGVLLDSPPDDDEVELEPNSGSSEFSDVGCEQDIDLGAPYMQRVMEPRSFFESCFPATGRWASVVNAARHSACLSRAHHNSPARHHNCTEASEPPALLLSECLELDITRHEYQQTSGPQNLHFVFAGGRVSCSESTCSEAGHVCVGCCCGSRAIGSRDSDGEKCSETGNNACLGCCGNAREDAIAVVSLPSPSVKSETGSPQRKVAADASLLLPVSSHESPSSALFEDMKEKLGEACAMSSPAHGLRVITSQQRDEASTSQCEVVVEQSEPPLERVDSDLDAFFSFPSSPSAKALGERGSGHIIEEMKSAKLMEDMGVRQMLGEVQIIEDEGELEGPRSRAESPRCGNALSKGAFGSPFPVLGASGRKTKPSFDKKLKLFSLERANTAALAKKHAASTSDGVLTSSSDSYLDTSSSNLSRPLDTTHDWDDYSSDLFEIHDMQPLALKSFSGVALSCLPIRKNFGCSHEACSDRLSDVESVPSSNSSALKYQIRGANAMRGADSRARILREKATKKAKSEQGTRVPVVPAPPAKDPSPQSKGKGISVMVLSLLRRSRHMNVNKHNAAAGKSGSSMPTIPKPTVVGGSNRPPLYGTLKNPSSSAVRSIVSSSSYEFNGKSIKALSIRDVLERQEKQEQRHNRATSGSLELLGGS